MLALDRIVNYSSDVKFSASSAHVLLLRRRIFTIGPNSSRPPPAGHGVQCPCLDLVPSALQSHASRAPEAVLHTGADHDSTDHPDSVVPSGTEKVGRLPTWRLDRWRQQQARFVQQRDVCRMVNRSSEDTRTGFGYPAFHFPVVASAGMLLWLLAGPVNLALCTCSEL
jgi:hypothetical protein